MKEQVNRPFLLELQLVFDARLLLSNGPLVEGPVVTARDEHVLHSIVHT